jgi:O-antigen ligase
MGHYLEYSVQYAQNRNIDLPLDLADKYVQHNIFLSILIENGIIGFICYMLMLGKWCHTGWEIWRYRFAPREAKYLVVIAIAFGISFIINGMFHDLLIVPTISSFLFFFAGLMRGVKANLAGQHKMLVESEPARNASVAPSLTTTATHVSALN